jgi:hypothetical protein
VWGLQVAVFKASRGWRRRAISESGYQSGLKVQRFALETPDTKRSIIRRSANLGVDLKFDMAAAEVKYTEYTPQISPIRLSMPIPVSAPEVFFAKF